MFVHLCRCGLFLRSDVEVQAHAIHTKHSSFSESAEEINPLSKDERDKQLKMSITF